MNQHPPASRNAVCPCGSGKRYKQCCGAMAGPQDVTPALDFDRLLQAALRAQQAGNLAEAERLYGQAITIHPDHFDALHMRGVVLLQSGRFDEARRQLLAAAAHVPTAAIGQFKRNLVICLREQARQDGRLDELCREPADTTRSARFLRSHRLSTSVSVARPTLSILVLGAEVAGQLVHTLGSLANSTGLRGEDTEILLPMASSIQSQPVQDVIDSMPGLRCRFIDTGGKSSFADQINIASATAQGHMICWLRAGDRWHPRWPEWLAAAMAMSEACWGFSGLRVLDEQGMPCTIQRSAELNSLLRSQDGLYRHGTASLAFIDFNPLATGRNLMVRRDAWHQSGGLDPASRDPVGEWAWRMARRSEPVFLDEPGYLIPLGSEKAHLSRPANHFSRWEDIIARPDADRPANPYLGRGVIMLRAKTWQGFYERTMPPSSMEALLACANDLEGLTNATA